MTRPIDIAEIVAMLAERIDALVVDLLPQAVREGAEWRVGSCAGEAGRSMAIHRSGPRAGVWSDFSGAVGRGDALDLVAAVCFLGDKKRALKWARAWLRIDPVDPAAFAVRRRAVAQKTAERAQHDEERRRGSALRLFLGSREQIAGTDAAAYLASRGIDLAQLGRQPRALRFHPGLVHPETGEIAPALVAGISAPDGKIVAVHRTFLERHAGGVRKLSSVENPKLTLGRFAGGAIRLWRGASGKPLNDVAPSEWVCVSEGVEDGLSAAIAAPETRVVAAVSLSAMAALKLPRTIAGVILLAQNDPPGSPAEAGLKRAIEHFHEAGFRVRIGRPPAGVKDINDLLRQGRDVGAA